MQTTSALPKSQRGRALVLVRLYGIGVVVGAFALPMIGYLVTAVTGVPPPTERITPSLLLAALLLAPITEEFAFRWLPFLLIRRTDLAIFVGALTFGVLHWVVAHPASGVVAFACGLLLGWVYSRSRVILDSIAMHAGINAGGVALAALLGNAVA